MGKMIDLMSEIVSGSIYGQNDHMGNMIDLCQKVRSCTMLVKEHPSTF